MATWEERTAVVTVRSSAALTILARLTRDAKVLLRSSLAVQSMLAAPSSTALRGLYS